VDYLDFELEIGPHSESGYPVSVLRSPAGEVHEVLRFQFSELELENHLLKLQKALLEPSTVRRRTLSPESEAVEVFGRGLFDALMTGDVRSCFDLSRREAKAQKKGLRVKLRIRPPELAALPWEILFDPRQADYIARSARTPIVRYIDLPQAAEPMLVHPPLRILVMMASPDDQPALNEERERVRMERALSAAQASGRVHVEWLEGQTWRDLQRALRGGPYHVFHFIGHGRFDSAIDEGKIALSNEVGETEYLTATQLGMLLADHDALRLVVLNACEGARGGVHDIFSGTAAILVRRGLPAVVAMQYEVSDRAAIEFARNFYESVTEGLPIDEAVSEARKAISMSLAGTVEWATPVLYMRSSDGVLFEMAREEVATPAERESAERERAERERTQALGAARQAGEGTRLDRILEVSEETPGEPVARRLNRKLPVAIGAAVGALALVGVLLFFLTTGKAPAPTRPRSGPPVLKPIVTPSPGAFTVALTWSQPPRGGSVRNYGVYRNGSLLAQVPGTTYQDTGVSPGTTYTYEIRAFPSTGTGYAATRVAVETPLPPKADARVEGRFRVHFRGVSSRGYKPSVAGNTFTETFVFNPVCTSGPCELGWQDTDFKTLKGPRFGRNAATYSNRSINGYWGLKCGSSKRSSHLVFALHVTKAKLLDGVWRAVQLKGTVVESETRDSCTDGHATWSVVASQA
jgi:hypothetical protein